MTLLGNSDESVERQTRFLQTVRKHNIDGLIICPAESTPAEQMRQVLAWGIPCVFASRYIAGVDADHHRIAMVGGIVHRRGSSSSHPSSSASAGREALGVSRRYGFSMDWFSCAAPSQTIQ